MIADEWRTVAALYASTTTLVERVRNPRGETRIRKQLRAPADAGLELARYRHEYAVNRGLDSPRIVAAVGRIDTAEHMQLLFRDSDARTLHDARAAHIVQGHSSGPSPESDPAYLDWALAMAEQTIDAVSALHEQGFVHRDLNPTNLVVAGNGTVQLIDLSVAAPIGDVQRLMTPVGTLPYLPPEQTGRIDARCDPRADIYSFGVLLYELCTGRLPFSAGDAASWVQAHIADEPIDPRSIAPHISAELHAMLMRMLAKLPQQRFASAQDVLAALRRCRAGLRSTTTRSTTTRSTTTRSVPNAAPPAASTLPTESAPAPNTHGFEAMRPAPTARLIERERELSFFADELLRIQSGSPAAIVLQGAPGSGRAALLAEVRATWKAAGALWCQADASSDAAELQSILLNVAGQAARQMLMRPAQELLHWQSRLQSDLGDRLALLVPWIDELAMITQSSIARGVGASGSGTAVASERAKVRPERRGNSRFAEHLLTPDVLRSFFASFAPTPLVLQINDAELWSNTGAAHAVACLPNGSVTLILTTTDLRTSSLATQQQTAPFNLLQEDGNSTVGNLIDQALACWPRAHARSLEPLSAAGVREMVGGLLHPIQTRDLEQLSAVLHSSCGGQPRLVLAAIEQLRRSGAVGWTAGRFALDRAALQAAEPDLIANGGGVDYLSNLDDTSRRALGYAACLGSPMELAVLTAVIDAPLRTVLSWLLEPLASGIVQRHDPLDGMPATLAFARRELEQQALAGLSRSERRQCHERAAHVLLLADADRAPESRRATDDSPGHNNPAGNIPAGNSPTSAHVNPAHLRRLSPRALRNDGQRLLRLTHHLNESVDLDSGLPSGAAARRLARFNLRAGELAQRGGMHRLAYRHFRFGLLLARGTPEPATVRALARGCCMSSWLLQDVQQAQRSATELLALPANDALAADEDALLARQCTNAALGHFPECLTQGSSKPPILDDVTVRAFTALLAAPFELSTDLRWRRLLASSAIQAMSAEPEITLCAAELLLREPRGSFDAGAHMAIAIVTWIGAGRRPAAARALLVAAQDIPQLDARTRILWSGYVAPRTGDSEAHIERLMDATRAALGSTDMSAVRLGYSALAGNRFWSHLSLRTQSRTLTALQRDLTDISGLPGGDTVGHYMAAIAGLRAGVQVLWNTEQPLPLLALLHQQSLALLLALLNDDHAALNNLLTQCQQPPALAMAFDIAPIHCALLAIAWIRSSDRQQGQLAGTNSGAAKLGANARHTTLAALRSRLRSAGVSPELRLLVGAEQAHAQGRYANAMRAWQKISEGSLPLPLRMLAVTQAALLPGPGKRQREQHAGVLRAEWGVASPGSPVMSPADKTEHETNNLAQLLPGILALSEALDPTAVAMRACREALHLTRSVGCWLFVRARTQHDQTHSDDLHLLAQVHASGAPPLQPPWELLRYVVRSGRALDPDAATELGASSALLLPFHDHVDASSADFLQGAGLAQPGSATLGPGTNELRTRRDNPVRGVLALALPDNERANSQDPHLQLLVSQLGVALRNARLHESLVFARDEYRGLFEAAREGLMEATPSGRMLQANPALARMLGFPSPALLLVEYPQINDLFGPEDDIAERIHTCWGAGADTRFEALAQRRDGSRLWVEISVRGRTRDVARANSASTQGKQPTMACALLDVTDRKEREQAERAQLQATASAAARSEFLAHISHEIRTPLNAIVGASQLANSASDPAQTRQLLRAVDAAARQLQALMGDVLDAARLDAGQLRLEHTPIDLRELIEECVTLFAPMAHSKGLDLHMQVQMPKQADAGSESMQGTWIEGDPLRLRQILHNLVGNAVKFTHQGEIWLRAEFDTVAEPAQLLLHVQDSGIGIAADTAATLFQPFVQADAGIARQYGGSGLGLAIVSQLVQLMGGTLSLASAPGKGSTFSCRLPLRVPTALPDRAQIAGLRVLLVDDNPLNRTVAEALLQRLGAQPTLADSGHSALQCVAEGTFDLILLDIHMPGLDGFATAHLLQQLPQVLPPIVALSADTTTSAMQRAIDAGFTDYLHKPLEPAQLAVLLGQIGHTASNTQADDAAHAADMPPGRPSGMPSGDVTGREQTDSEAQDFDLQLALHRHGDNTKLLDRTLQEFVVHYADAPKDLSTLISTGQTTLATRLAHNLKSVAGSFGAQRLAACAAALEAQQRTVSETAQDAERGASRDHRAPERLLVDFGTAHQRFMHALSEYQQRAPH